MDKKRTGMTYVDWCDNLLIVEDVCGSLWAEDADGCYHFDGVDGAYFQEGKNSRDFFECSDKVKDYLSRLYCSRRGLDDDNGDNQRCGVRASSGNVPSNTTLRFDKVTDMELILEENDRILREHLGDEAWAEIMAIILGDEQRDA